MTGPAPIRSPEADWLEWRVHLARGQGGRLPWIAAAVLGAAAAAYWLLGSAVAAILAAIALAGATAEFLLPIRYRLTAEAAELRNGLSVRRIRWADVRRAVLVEDGVYLSPLLRPSRVEAYRGLLLRCDNNRDEVVAAVRRWRGRRAA